MRECGFYVLSAGRYEYKIRIFYVKNGGVWLNDQACSGLDGLSMEAGNSHLKLKIEGLASQVIPHESSAGTKPGAIN